MTDTEFVDWAELHCEATAAPPAARASLIANRGIFADDWRATLAELGECTRRMVLFMRVPKFAPEAAEAVAVELMTLRRERAEQAKPLRDDARPIECQPCEDSGLVVVPHWRCVEVPHDAPPRLVAYRDYSVAYRCVVEVSVRCDRPGCRAGRRQADMEAKREADKRRMSLSTFLDRIGGGLAIGTVREMLTAHNRAIAEEARRTNDKYDGPFEEVVASICGRTRNTEVP